MTRLDIELVNRNLINSRAKAKELIKDKKIKINGKIQDKPAYMVNDTDIIEIEPNDILKYVSRGGLKLEHAIDMFNIDFNNKNIMDIGSSTGGFTDCSLQHGANKVVAIDVGTNIMVDELRNNNKVELYENLNIKDAKDELFNNIDIVVTDVSFISLKHIIDKIKDYHINELVLLIKPQFECGKEIADKYKGIILDKNIHLNIIKDITSYLNDASYYLHNIDVSPIRGGSGNIEYVSYFKYNIKPDNSINFNNIVDKAFKGDKHV